jgi:Fe-S-cluster containining protein
MEQSIYRIIDTKVYKLSGTCDPRRCGAFCCRFSQMKVKNITRDEREYFIHHGCEIKDQGNLAHVLMPTPCTKLDTESQPPGMSCTIYETRPQICRKYARMPTELFFSPECMLFWKELTGREAQVAIMKAGKGDPSIFI